MKKIMLLMMVVLMFMFIGCEVTQSTDQKQEAQTEQLTAEAQRQVGMPDVVNFQQRKLMKMIFELQDQENLICYAYIKSDYQGKRIRKSNKFTILKSLE